MDIWRDLKRWNAKTQEHNVAKHIIIGGVVYAVGVIGLTLLGSERINLIIGAWFFTMIVGGTWEVLQWFKVIPGSANGLDAFHSQLIAMLVTILMIIFTML